MPGAGFDSHLTARERIIPLAFQNNMLRDNPKPMRRATLLRSLALLAAAGWLPVRSQAGGLLKMMIPVKPGGGWDATGRALGRALQEAGMDAEVSFDNKGGGAAGTIGLAQFVGNSRGDPHALMVMGAVMLGGLILDKPPVTLSQATPIARLTSEYNVIVLPQHSPFKTLKDVTDQMRQDPASVRWGGGSRGSTEHIAVAMLARELGVDTAKINYIAFRGGGEATAAILAGHVAVGGGGYSELVESIRAGRLKALALTAPQRLPGVDIPTLKELGMNVVIGNWRGVYGAPGITLMQSQALVDLVSRATRTQAWRQAVEKNGWTPALLTGPAFGKFVDEEFSSLRGLMGRVGMAALPAPPPTTSTATSLAKPWSA